MVEFNKDRITDICSKSIVFRGIDKEALKNFFSEVPYKVAFVKKGELIITEDEYIDNLTIILDGEVNICKYSPNGSESLLAKSETHEVLALDILCTPSRQSFYYAYTTKPSFILQIDKDVLIDKSILYKEDALIIYKNITTYLANTCAKKCHKIEVVSQKSVRDKIMTYLLIQKKNTNLNKFKITLDRDQLANYLCVNRSVLSHELSLMQQEEIIKFKKNEFEIIE